MAILHIHRKRECVNGARNYQLLLDGKPLGRIANGASLSFDVAAGTHTLSAKIDWTSSQSITFQIEEGVEKEFTVSAFKGSSWLWILLAAALALPILSRFLDTTWLTVLLVSGLLYWIYQLTIGRRHYLQLTMLP